jgi:FHS family L-fucose permease-like MFS transporter
MSALPFPGALFVIVCGIVFLETAGTGTIVALGSPQRAERRINLAQVFNAIGAAAGILIGREYILSSHDGSAADRASMNVAAQVGILAPNQNGVIAMVGVSLFMSVMSPAVYATGLRGHANLAKVRGPLWCRDRRQQALIKSEGE